MQARCVCDPDDPSAKKGTDVMKIQTRLLCIGLLIPALGGCDSGSPDARTGGTDADALADAEAGVNADAGVATDAAVRSGGAGRVFDRDALRGEGCPLLSASDVAEVAGLAATDVTANPVMDCVYEWDGGYAILHSTRVHRTAEFGREHYARATSNMTQAETQASVDALDKTMDAKVAAGEIDKDQAAIVGTLTAAVGGQALTNIALDDIGDQASHEGTRIKVLVDNVTFDISARDGNRDFDLALSRALAQRVVHNLEQL